MNTQHTPGPWRIGTYKREVYSESHNDFIAVCAGEASDKETEKAEANARLIAAAPELLGALIEITTHSHDTLGAYEMSKIAKAAIAKATGKEVSND